MSPQKPRFYDFGPFRFDTHKHRLSSGGDVVHLSGKSTQALEVLLENPGKLLEREALMRAVWSDAFVEDANLTVAISQLRKALGQQVDPSEYIETIPRVGYRFIAEVRAVDEVEPPVIIEKHTRAQTIIEEEYVDDDVVNESPVSSPTRDHFVQNALNNRVVRVVAPTVLVLATLVALYHFRYEQSRASDGMSPLSSVRSIAVLPPRVLGPDSDRLSLSLGIADALITRLAGLHKFSVRPISSVMQYATLNEDPAEIARHLDVDAVLDGTVQMHNGNTRFTFRLLDGNSYQLWAESFDSSSVESFQIEDAASQHISMALVPSLGSEQPDVRAASKINREAYTLYLKGKYYWSKRGEESAKSIDCYRQAIAIDPQFAEAYVGLAAVDATSFTPSPEADAMIEKALQLDNNLSDAHATYAFIRMFHHWDWSTAEKELDHAIELDPNSVTAHHWKGVWFSLHGQLEEAKREMERALQSDPTALIVLADLGQLYYFAHDYDEAKRWCDKALQLDPNFEIAHRYLWDIYRMKGLNEQALNELAIAENAGQEQAAHTVRERYTREGLTATMRRHVYTYLRYDEATRNSSAIAIAQFFCVLGDRENAMKWVETSIDNPHFTVPYLAVDPLYDDLRQDPRFRAAVQRMKLPTK